MFKYLTYVVLPICLIQAVALNGYMDTVFNMSAVNSGSSDVADVLESFGWSYGGLILTSVIGALLQVSVVYAFMSIYESSENGLTGVTGNILKPQILRNLKRSLLIVVFFMVVTILVILLMILLTVALSPWILVPIVFGLVAMSIPITLFMPVYLMEDISLTDAFKKAMRLGFSCWWSTFAIIFVLSIIVSFVQGVFAIPYYIAVIVKTVLGIQGSSSEFLDSAGYSFMMYLFGVLQSWATYLVGTVITVGLAFQYGHASEKLYHVTMEGSIKRFEDL